MTTPKNETLSQLMDGEWQDIDAASCVENACADSELQAKWSRYHLIRDVMRNEAVTVDTPLVARISAAIEDEPTYSNVAVLNTDNKRQGASQVSSIEKPVSQPSMLKLGAGGFALAACVALATVVGLNVWQGAPGNNAPTVQSVAAVNGATINGTNAGQPAIGVVLPEVEFVSNKGTYWVTPSAERSSATERRLNMLLSEHIENSPTADRQGMLPYSRLVGYDAIPAQ